MLNKKSILAAVTTGVISLSCNANNTLNLRVFNNTKDILQYQNFQASGCSATVNSSSFQHNLSPGQAVLIPINLSNGPYLGGNLNFTNARTGTTLSEAILDPSIIYAGTASFKSATASYTSLVLAEEHYSHGSKNHMEVPYANISITQ